MTTKVRSLIVLIIGALGILDSLTLLLFFDVSVHLGVVLPGLVGILLILFALTILFNIKFFIIKNRTIRLVLLGVLALWCASFVIVESMIIIAAQQPDEPVKTDYMLILGAGLKGDRMSPTLASRTEKGLAYLKVYPGTRVIVSGGQGPGEEITEAEAMRRFLVANGIDRSRIVKEERSTSTIENLRLSKAIMSQYTKSNKIMIVTSDYHMLRAKMLAKRAGLEPYGLPTETPYYILPNSYLREYFAVLKSYILDR